MPQKVITWQKGCIIITSQNTFLNKIIILAKMTQKRRKQRLSNTKTQKRSVCSENKMQYFYLVVT